LARPPARCDAGAGGGVRAGLGDDGRLALATGAAQRAPALVVGALLVAGSDLAVARERFATKGFVNKAVGLPTYYLGQTLVALALVGP
jgi:uncharacterized membrane protein YhhN